MKHFILGCVLSVSPSLIFAQGKVIVKDSDSLRIEIESLGIAVNSTFEDYAPVITADGNDLFFTSRRPFTEKEKLKNTASTENIYHCVFDPETESWSIATPVGESINVPGRNNSNVAISNDGQRLLMYQDDSKGNGDIYESVLVGNTWSSPSPISNVINSPSHESSATISPDGRTVYFVSNREGGTGKRDIWQTTKYENGTWSIPRNLGKAINSVEDEEAVFIHPDGKTLYFSSKGHNSIGGYDVFKSVYENDEWSKPVSLGEPINTTGDDLFFVLTADGKKGYYASSRENGEKNIFQIRFISKTNSQSKFKMIKGTIRNKKTQDPIEAKIEIIDNEKNEVIGSFLSNSETGRYLFSLPSGKNYGISVTAPYYLFYSDNITSADTAKFEQIIKDVELQKIERGTKIILKNIFFDYDKYTLKEESQTELRRLFQLMANNPRLVIELSGHTDTKGDASYNQQLSENRAKAVVDYLVLEGIPRERFKFVGYGETKPIISDEEIAQMPAQKQADAHAQNRRTEIQILNN